MSDLENKGIKEILGGFTAKQIWGIVVALGTLFGGGVWLGQKVPGQPAIAPLPSTQTNLIPCSKASDYPRGIWLVAGEDRSPRKAALSRSILFKDATSGTGSTNEKNGGIFDFTLDQVPLPGHHIKMSGHDDSGYTSSFEGLISESGCSIEGNFKDSQSHGGPMTLFWYEPKNYWIAGK